MSGATHRVFVYGSLRAGEYNHSDRFAAGATLVAEGLIRDAKLFNLGAYPCIVKSAGDIVKGEVYDLDETTFKWVNRMELGAGYTLEPVLVHATAYHPADIINDHDVVGVGASAYFHAEVPIYGTPVPSGDWTKRHDEA